MGTNKLAMVNKSKTKKKTIKKKTINKKIINVPFSSKKSLGSKASLGNINYNYQKYYNIFAFLKKIINKNKKLQKIVCIPKVGKGWMQSFLKVHFFKNIDSLNHILDSVKPVDMYESKKKFIHKLKKCMNHRFIPINLEIIVPNVGTHANVIILDTKKKTVELFEPHGARNNDSELESISRAYYKISKNVQKFFAINFPDYTYIPPSKYESKQGLQERIDAFSGLCVTWSLLYLHYRILNPDISPKNIIDHLETVITKDKLLKYTRYVEDMLKGKI